MPLHARQCIASQLPLHMQSGLMKRLYVLTSMGMRCVMRQCVRALERLGSTCWGLGGGNVQHRVPRAAGAPAAPGAAHEVWLILDLRALPSPASGGAGAHSAFGDTTPEAGEKADDERRPGKRGASNGRERSVHRHPWREGGAPTRHAQGIGGNGTLNAACIMRRLFPAHALSRQASSTGRPHSSTAKRWPARG